MLHSLKKPITHCNLTENMKKSSIKSFVVKSGGFIWHFLAAFDCQGLLTAGSAVRQGFSAAAGN